MKANIHIPHIRLFSEEDLIYIFNILNIGDIKFIRFKLIKDHYAANIYVEWYDTSFSKQIQNEITKSGEYKIYLGNNEYLHLRGYLTKVVTDIETKILNLLEEIFVLQSNFIYS